MRRGWPLTLLLLWGGWLVAQEPPLPPPEAGAFPEPVSVPAVLPQGVITERAMVAAAHPLAARTGVDILRAGGNAIDAMVAVQLVLNVVEPQSSGIGGGCFILWHDRAQGQTHFVDGREECPREARRVDFLGPDGRVLGDTAAMTGGQAVGVPGTVAAMHLAHSRWGKLAWRDLFQPAIKLAEEGIGVTPRLRWAILANRARLLQAPASRAVFLLSDGSAPEIGHVLKQPDLGRTFRLLAEQGPQVFYEGELAQQIVAAVQGAPIRPGRLSLADLKDYRAVVRAPFAFEYRGFRIIAPPSPSAGGYSLALLLKILEGTPVEDRRPGTASMVSAFARAESVAFALRDRHFGDVDFLPDQPADVASTWLRQPETLRDWAKSVQPGKRWKLPTAAGPDPGVPTEGENTTHFSIVDGDGNFLACTTTIEHGMGSGLIVPGAGFLLNNELTDFDLSRVSGPNALDPRRQPRRTALNGGNLPGGKRPRSSMTPVIVFRGPEPVLTLGSPGGSQIIGVVGQVLTGVLDHDLDMQAAINLPRVSCRNRGSLELEGHFPDRPEMAKRLQLLGWPLRPLIPGYEAWGGAQGIRRRADGRLEGGADPRREGAVRGY